jgi:major membrane immunogen (membrane-anchored lipoprotein)
MASKSDNAGIYRSHDEKLDEEEEWAAFLTFKTSTTHLYRARFDDQRECPGWAVSFALPIRTFKTK